LLLVRCLRPDRLTAALDAFARKAIGAKYADLDAERNSYGVLEQCFADSSPKVPIYFLLSPGADVVADVDRLASERGMDAGRDYHNVSLGQGQDVVATRKLGAGHVLGHWVFLNNVHLMPTWLRSVEKLLDDLDSLVVVSSGGAGNKTVEEDDAQQQKTLDPKFRLFLSSDPSPLIPIGLLDRSIKITLDPPSGLKANLRQALSVFRREEYEEHEPRTRGILFALCHFHAVMLERRKFGPQGTNVRYPFSVGDLTSSAAVLLNYMETAPSQVPWQDLRYLFGEIVYGGCVTNDWDRRVCAEYLNFFMKDDVLDEMATCPFPNNDTGDFRGGQSGASRNSGLKSAMMFHAPQTSASYDKVVEHVDASEFLAEDSPLAFGMHPNAEIGVRTERSLRLCRAILDLGSGGAGLSSSAFGGGERESAAEAVLQDVLEQVSDEELFDVEKLRQSLAEDQQSLGGGPFQVVFLQECELVNALVVEIRSSLENLSLGFRGEVTVTESMEALQAALALDRVPASWTKISYPSERPLALWILDLQHRLALLRDWTVSPSDVPIVTWLSGLFNPASFLTAVMQTAAQTNQLELDKLSIAVEVTKKFDASDFTAPSRDGSYVHGLSLEGAKWNTQSGMLQAAAPREMTSPMPVLNCKALPANRVESSVYCCPCYKTLRRAHTFVFAANLKTKAPAAKWVLAGTALILDATAA